MKRTFILFLICVSLASANISFSTNKERIEPGMEFDLQVMVPLQELNTYNPRELPVLTPANGFQVLGLDSADTRSNDFFNRYKVRRYDFHMKAPKGKTGKLNLGRLSWSIRGAETEIANSLQIEVQRSLNSGAMEVSIRPTKSTVYEGEQFSISIKFHTYQHFLGNISAQSLDLGNDFILHRAELNNLDFQRVPGTFENEASAKFAWMAPTRSGDLTIPKMSFKYTQQGEPKRQETSQNLGGFSFSSVSITNEPIEKEAFTKPVKIKVLPLPEGAPEGFSGMVGNYSLKANFDKTSLKVGEALTLSITIAGDGKPGTVTDPKLPDFSEFRAVPPENNIEKKERGGKIVTTKTTKIFLYPKRKGTFEIPEITYSWFNPQKKAYETAKAGPWTINVEKGDAQTATVVASGGSSEIVPVAKQEIETLGDDIRFLKDVPEESFANPLYKSAAYYAFALVPIPLYLLAVFGVRRHRKRRGDFAKMRQSGASKRFRQGLSNAEQALAKGETKEFYAALETSLIDLLSDRTNLEFRGMVRSARAEALSKRGVPAEKIAEIEAWLDKCGAARFAPVAAASENKQTLTDFKKFVDSLEALK